MPIQIGGGEERWSSERWWCCGVFKREGKHMISLILDMYRMRYENMKK